MPLRPAGVDTHPHPRGKAVDLDRFDGLVCLQHRRHRHQRVTEHRHQAVAHPFDDPAAGVQQRRLHRLRQPSQQGQGGLVAGLQRPGGETDQIGEDQRRLGVARNPRHPLGQGLPDLQSTQTHLARRRGPISHQPVGRPRRGLRTTVACGGQRVAEVRVAGQRAAHPANHLDHPVVVGGAVQPGSGVIEEERTAVEVLGDLPRFLELAGVFADRLKVHAPQSRWR